MHERDLQQMYADLDKRSDAKFVPEDGKYVGKIAVKDGKPFVEIDKEYHRVKFALIFAEGEYAGRWAFGELSVQSLASVPDEQLKAASQSLGIAHRTIKALTGGDESTQGFKDKAEWSTEDLLDYTSAVLSSVNGKAVNFSTKRRVKDGQPVEDKKGNQRYSVYINGVVA